MEAKVITDQVYTEKDVAAYQSKLSKFASEGWTVKAATELRLTHGCLCCKTETIEMLTILEK